MTGNLIVPEPTVLLVPGGDEQDVVPCGTQYPNAGQPDCRYSRTVNEGGGVPAGMIQVSEVWKLLRRPDQSQVAKFRD